MITCRNCTNTYADGLEECPHCGYRSRTGGTTLAPRGTAIRRQQAIAKARGLATPPPETPPREEKQVAVNTPTPAQPAAEQRTKTDPGLIPIPADGEAPPPSPFEDMANALRKELDTRGRLMSWVAQNVAPERTKELLPLASHGDTHAMLLLGISLFARAKDKSSLRDAMVWLQQAANYGSGHASTALGVIYQGATGMPPNPSVARQHYERAMAANVPMAANNLGNMCEKGEGLAADATKARELFALGAGQGLSLAMYNLGRCLMTGIGGPKDAKKALEWLSRAVEKGDDDAMVFLARACFTGSGVPVDRYKAGHLLNKAADAGNNEATQLLAQFNLPRTKKS
jgi:hypothetical protein